MFYIQDLCKMASGSIKRIKVSSRFLKIDNWVKNLRYITEVEQAPKDI